MFVNVHKNVTTRTLINVNH